MTSDAPPIASPCRKLCQLHPIEKLCLGCFRRIDEIASWTRLSRKRQAAIVADLPARRAAWTAKEEEIRRRRGL